MGFCGVISDHLADSSLGRPGVRSSGHQLWQLEPSVELVGTVRAVQQIPFRKMVPLTVPTKEPLVLYHGACQMTLETIQKSLPSLLLGITTFYHIHTGSHVKALMGHI